MNTARLLEDGVLELPQEIIACLNIKPKDMISVEIGKDGVIRLYPKIARIEDVCGMLHPPNNAHVSIEQMDTKVAEAFRRGEL